MDGKSGVGSQAVSLPAGDGNVSGLGEEFKVDLNTGILNYEVPMDVPEGIAGFTPSLRLVYHHGGGNGPFGLGWSLPLMGLARRVDAGVPRYEDEDGDQDQILWAGEQELVLLPDGTYRLAVEGRFLRLERVDEGWVVTEPNGVRHECGLTPAGRIEMPGFSGQVFRWAIERSVDPCGNQIVYKYLKDGHNLYLHSVEYAIFSLTFLYESRPDPVINGRPGFLTKLSLRCRAIELRINTGPGPRLIRSWTMEYAREKHSKISLLTRIMHTGHGPASDGSGDVSLPPLEFDYISFEPEHTRFRRYAATELPGPGGLDLDDTDLLDLEGSGLPGIIRLDRGRAWYWPNRGNLTWGAPRELPRAPALSGLAESRVRFIDVDADGRADLLVGKGPMSGYYHNDGEGGWDDFVKYRQSPSVSWASPALRLADIDGDGVIDALVSGQSAFYLFYNQREAGWSEPQILRRRSTPEHFPDVRLDDGWVRLADMNGDGLVDLVAIRPGRIEYWPSLGRGRFGDRVTLTPPAGERLPRWEKPERVILADVNGDGLADIVYADFDQIDFWVNRSGIELGERKTIFFVPPAPAATLRPADMLGTGTVGLLWSSDWVSRGGSRYAYLDFTGGVRPYLLSSVNNNMGLVTSIEYRSSSDFAVEDREIGQPWTTHLPFGLPVTHRVVQTDVVRDNKKVIEYRYHDGHFDGKARKFEGFSRVEQIERGDSSRPDRLTVYHYHIDEDRARGRDYAALNRCLYKMEVFGLDGSSHQDRPYRVEESDYEITVLYESSDGDPKRRVILPLVRETRVISSERTDESQVDLRRYKYDLYGNVVEEERVGQGAIDGEGRELAGLCTRVNYARNLSAWILGLPSQIIKETLDGDVLEETRRFYDGTEYVGEPLGLVSRGQLSREEKIVMTRLDWTDLYGSFVDPLSLGYHTVMDDSGAVAFAVQNARYRYDARGNRIGELDPLGRESTTIYDHFGLYPVERRDSLGHTTVMAYDYAARQIRTLTDANGAVTSFGYDALGRGTQVFLPGDPADKPGRTYRYIMESLPNGRSTSFCEEIGSTRICEVVEYQDGFGCPLQKRTSHNDRRYIVEGPAEVNPWGQERMGYTPRFGDGPRYEAPMVPPEAPRRTLSYDALGRPVETIGFDAAISRALYRPGQVVLFDPSDTDTSPDNVARGHPDTPRIEHLDAWRRVVAVEERLGTKPVITRLSLDPLGRLMSVVDPSGTIVQSLRCDRLGNRICIDHRDAGRRIVAYDARGRVAWTRDARGQEMNLSYDELGRALTLSSGGMVIEQYEYDAGPGHNLVGRLARAIDRSGERTFSYDLRGNVVERSHRLPGQQGTFKFAFTYDAMERQVGIQYPDGATVTYEYYRNHMVKGIPGIIDHIDYNPARKMTRQIFNNGVVTELGYDVALSSPAEIRTGPAGAPVPFFHRRFAYDARKNLLSIADLVPGDGRAPNAQTFEYDTLCRLITATGADDQGAYSHKFEYDSQGNILRHGDSGDLRLHYDAAGAANRLTRLEYSDGNTFPVSSDENGCITTLPGRTFQWNFKNQLERVIRADGTMVEFTYDCQGLRAGKRIETPEGEVSEAWTLGNAYEITSSGTARFVLLGRTRLAEIRETGTLFLHGDQLGSVAVYTDQAGNRVARQEYYPFGRSNRNEGDPRLQRYSGETFDPETGLYCFNARYYAPEIGRFLSADPWVLFRPEMALCVPQAFNLYAYVANNPSNYVDPSGLLFWMVTAAIIAVVIAAVAAAAGAIIVGATQGWDQAWRGALIGLNAGLNLFFGSLIFGPVIGGALGVITFLGVFENIAHSEVYQSILGWSSWFMPMSWLVHAVGLIAFLLNAIGYLLLWALPEGIGRIFGREGWGVDVFEITDMGVDWRTGVIYTVGGWVGNANTWDTAFNLGGFTFVDNNWHSRIPNWDDMIEHESGHALSLGAFGSIFHLVEWFDEMGRGGDAAAERIADSNVTPPPGNSIPQWG